MPRSPEIPSDSPERRRDELIEQLDRRVSTALELFDATEQLPEGASEDEVDRTLDGIMTRARAQLDVAWEKAARLDQLRIQRATAASAALAAYESTGRSLRVEIAHGDEARLAVEERELLRDPDVLFWHNLRSVVDAMRRKYRLLAAHPSTSDLLRAMGKSEPNISPSDVLEVRRTPFEASIIVTPENLIRLRPDPNVAGLHYQGTPFSIIRQGPPDRMAEIIQHEAVHNVIDAAGEIRAFNPTVVVQRIGRELTDTDQTIQTRAMADLQAMTPSELIDPLQNELIAGLDEAEARDFRLPPSTPESARELGHVMFWYYADVLSTAGQQAKETVDALAKIAANGPADARPVASDLAAQFRDTFERMVETIRASLREAKTRGPDAARRVHALMAILPPSRYRHIPRYLEATAERT